MRRQGGIFKWKCKRIRAALVTLRTAKMMMYGVNSFNHLEVLSFTHSNQAALDQWIKVFQEHGVKIYER